MKDLTLKDMSFDQLVVQDEQLSSLRQQYQLESPDKRRTAAEFEYESGLASDLFNSAIAGMDNCAELTFSGRRGPCLGAVLALAIDPKFAPGLLTVGATEYQLGRTEQAMKLLLKLVETQDDDFVEIIEKAADFLIDEKDYTSAKCLYESATQQHPKVGIFLNGLAYCFGKLDKAGEAVYYSRKAVELEPKNPLFWNDLGYALMERGFYKDAEEILLTAIGLSEEDYELAKNNLNDLRQRMRLNEDKRNSSGK